MIFPILSSDVRANQCHSGWKNDIVAKKSFQMLSFSDRERALPPSTEIGELTFEVKKSAMKLHWVSMIFR